MGIPKSWEKAKFKIQWRPNKTGAKTVRGFVNPPFAVHQLDDLWCITHLPTGLSIGSVAGRHPTQEQAIEASDYIRTLWDGWDAALPASTKEMRDIRERIERAVKERWPNVKFKRGGELGKAMRLNA